jgi:hypothetical protein
VTRVEAAPAVTPIVVAPVRAKKSVPIKHLGALDKLFPK